MWYLVILLRMAMQQHRVRRLQHDAHGRPERARPLRERTEGAVRPVVLTDQPAQLPACGEEGERAGGGHPESLGLACAASPDVRPARHGGRWPAAIVTERDQPLAQSLLAGSGARLAAPHGVMPRYFPVFSKPIYKLQGARGTSRRLLPRLLPRIEGLSLLLHDSQHTYRNVSWELRTVTPHLIRPAAVLVDDASGNRAFEHWVERVRPAFYAVVAEAPVGVAVLDGA
jgi:hypothetical protein